MTNMEGHVEWTMPAPLWPTSGDPAIPANRLRFRTPAILRFATDTFMQDFMNLLNTQPNRLPEFVAAPETWSSPPSEPAPATQLSGMMLTLHRARTRAMEKLQSRGVPVIGQALLPALTRPLKLFQPAHQRFYLVTTCLVCRTLGLPDRTINAGAQERATFVIRLLQPHADADPVNPDPTDCDELALVNGAWQPVGSIPGILFAGEQQYPLSPVTYLEEDQRNRRLLMGLVPVGDRERLLQAARPSAAGQAPPPPLIDARQMMLKTQVIYPLSSMEGLANQMFQLASSLPVSGSNVAALAPPTPAQGPQAQFIDDGNAQIQETSWYILLDLARYLQTNLNPLWQQILSNGASAPSPDLADLWNMLAGASFGGVTMIKALQQAFVIGDSLDKGTVDKSNWPSGFVFYSVTPAAIQQVQPPLNRTTFENLIVAALPAVNPNPPLPARTVAQANANPQGTVWFSMRCVLERPNCGNLTPPLVSEPTTAFQMAPYFDPDAPARPIRIGLPIDTTPAGLRKFDKNTAFVMSDTLCGQVGKLSGVSFGDLVLSVLPWPFHQDLPGGGGSTACTPGGVPGGMVCSFSIPIITIVALILLIIFVKLLDIVFFWMPFFQICLPLPNFTKDSQ